MKALVGMLLVSHLCFAAAQPTRSVAMQVQHTYVGLASDSAVTGLATPAASMLFALSEVTYLQTYFAIPTIDPFLFSIGANMKMTVFGTHTAGFHLGGGLGFQLTNAVSPLSSSEDTRDLVLRFNGIAGVHFQLVNRVMVIADGGATIDLNVDKSDADFQIGGNSAILGLSLLYEL